MNAVPKAHYSKASERPDVDKHMQTSNPDIYAAGDVIEFDGRTYGIWPAAMEQGKIAGTNISGGNATYGATSAEPIQKPFAINFKLDLSIRNKDR